MDYGFSQMLCHIDVVDIEKGGISMSEQGFGQMPELLTVEDCTDVLRVSRDTVWRMAKSGELPAVKLVRRWYVPRKHLLERIEDLVNVTLS